jgi:hypothetical protein
MFGAAFILQSRPPPPPEPPKPEPPRYEINRLGSSSLTEMKRVIEDTSRLKAQLRNEVDTKIKQLGRAETAGCS